MFPNCFLTFFDSRVVLGKAIRAHEVPRGLVGAHKHGGPIGMDFRTNHWITITHLGVFDSGSDGLRSVLARARVCVCVCLACMASICRLQHHYHLVYACYPRPSM